MFLKSIEMFGFKSFADRSRIEFTDGISALLGPNGCGKSNVVDAIKWVLGEQATKSLRAEKMEDVIFNGTEARKALNVAEVTLTLSNDENLLPIDVPEIAIKRRLYRSGESEYLINNTPARLKEIRELFYDTGIGKSAYSIMEQGKIDQVLSNKPEERRHLFEEAASITKYKMKGQEAERKLEKTSENMFQVQNILHEVKRSHDSLQKQAEKTATYRKLRDEIFEIELTINLLRLREYLDKKDRQGEQLKEKSAKRDEIKAAIDGINESLEENLDMVNSMESKLIESQKSLYGVEIEKDNIENQRRMLAENLGELEGKLGSDQSRLESSKEKLDSLNNQVKEKEEKRHEYIERINEVNDNIVEFEKSIATAEGRITSNDEEIQNQQNKMDELDSQRDTLQDELRSLTDNIVEQLDEKLKEKDFSFHEQEKAQGRISESIGNLAILARGRNDMLQDYIATGNKAGLQKVADGLVEIMDKVEGLKAEFQSYADGVPALLADFLAPEGIITQKRNIDKRILENHQAIDTAKQIISDKTAENKTLQQKINEYRTTLGDLKINQVRLQTQLKGFEDSITSLKNEAVDQEKQLKALEEDINRTKARLDQITEQMKKAEDIRDELHKKEAALQKELNQLEKSISKHNSSVFTSEKKLKSIMEKLASVQAQVERVQMDLSTTEADIRNTYENFKDRHSRDLGEFEDRLGELQGSVKEQREILSRKKEASRSLGSVNLMAPEEYAEVKERYDFLNNQLNDLEKAKEDLSRVTEEIRHETAELFLKTYEKIKKNFHTMFRRLFGGGRAELRLLESENVLESGIEMYAQPPGKKMENIALLSGGERSMTAVALLFATYMVKPSPFCLLDEIDAALDEHNVSRFVNMLMEFGETSQFIVITHNKKTVAGAKTMLGVTMQESGVSKVVSIRLEDVQDE